MPDYEEIIKLSKANLESLSEKLKDFDKSFQEIKSLKEAAEGISDIFNKKFEEIVELSKDYTNTLGAATKNYLDGNNTLFTAKLSELSIKINELEKEISRLLDIDFFILFETIESNFIEHTRKDLSVELKRFEEKSIDLQSKINNLHSEISRLTETDLIKLFKDLQKVFIDQTREDLAIELNRFEEKSTDLQNRIDDLKKQIERLDSIHLEKHFDKLQKTLGEIFGAINAINLTVTNVIQTLTGIVQSLGNIQIAIDSNHKEAKQLLNNFIESAEKHFADQEKQAAKNAELLEHKMQSLSEQNELLMKEVKINRIIKIVGFVVIIIILVYVIVK